jgi:hypothetical protein
MQNNSSFKVWQGPSPFSGESISAIITNIHKPSQNPKTGDMCQLWMLSTEHSPTEAIHFDHGDSSVCGNCPMLPCNAPSFKESCYVARRSFQAPGNVWRYNIGLDVDMEGALENIIQSSKAIRYGGYGDPAMIPENIFTQILLAAKIGCPEKPYTCYTHQQNSSFASWIKPYAMASTHCLDESRQCWDEGWRTFRITDSPKNSKHEVVCPNFTHQIKCVDCCLCDGKRCSSDNRKSITIPRH